MRRIDRLFLDFCLLERKQNEQGDGMQIANAYITIKDGRWKVKIRLWDGVPYPKAKRKEIHFEIDTKGKAQTWEQTWEQTWDRIWRIERAHPPKAGEERRGYPLFIDDLDKGKCLNGKRTFERQKRAPQPSKILHW